MFNLLFIISIIGSIVCVINETFTATIPAENWENRSLYYEDVRNGVSTKQRMENLKNGKYKMPNNN